MNANFKLTVEPNDHNGWDVISNGRRVVESFDSKTKALDFIISNEIEENKKLLARCSAALKK